MDTMTANMKASMGGYGGAVKTAGTYSSLNCCAIKALEDSVVTATGNIDDFTSVTILGGDTIPGEFTQVIVTSGKVILYDNVNISP
jgi:hypothetical protein